MANLQWAQRWSIIRFLFVQRLISDRKSSLKFIFNTSGQVSVLSVFLKLFLTRCDSFSFVTSYLVVRKTTLSNLANRAAQHLRGILSVIIV